MSIVDEKPAKARLPSWIRVRVGAGGAPSAVAGILGEAGLHTVCASAHCPNQSECFGRGTATFLILGDRCTRRCRFCAVEGGQPAAPDPGEAGRVAAAAARLKLRYVVVTSVTRDDLPDGGAGAFAETILALRAACQGVRVEVLTPDFGGREADIDTVLDAQPDVFNHNLETVRRLQRTIRPQADYARSLAVLAHAARRGREVVVKSGMMVGLGETDEELFEALGDLHAAGCRALTIGQYLSPSPAHQPVARFVPPATFEEYRATALRMGFSAVAAGPMVRSSYNAEALCSTPTLGAPAGIAHGC